MNLTDLFPIEALADALQQEHVKRNHHPELPLQILTYTAACQYGHIWNDVTMQCRGLIVDGEHRIVALPFPKIFVTGMHGVGHDFAPALPAEPFEIFEKADGSLAIVYHYDGAWHAASKGSFVSEQAQWAQAVLDAADLSQLDPELTYLAEAIYPGNRIVVDYGQRAELMLLAAFRPANGEEELLSNVAAHWAPIGPVCRTWGLSDDITALEKLAADSTTVDGQQVGGIDEEGYVIRFQSGQRAKVKLANYLALHKLFTGTNERTIWEVLASGQDPSVLFDQVPDEFADWARQIADQLREQHSDLISQANADFCRAVDRHPEQSPDRKSFAQEAVKSPHRAALFMLYDGNEAKLDAWAWKQIKPRADKPYKTDDDA